MTDILNTLVDESGAPTSSILTAGSLLMIAR